MKRILGYIVMIAAVGSVIAANDKFNTCLCQNYITPKVLGVLAKMWPTKVDKDSVILELLGTAGCAELVDKASAGVTKLAVVCENLGELVHTQVLGPLLDGVRTVAGSVGIDAKPATDLISGIVPGMVKGVCASEIVKIVAAGGCELPAGMQAGAVSVISSSLAKCIAYTIYPPVAGEAKGSVHKRMALLYPANQSFTSLATNILTKKLSYDKALDELAKAGGTVDDSGSIANFVANKVGVPAIANALTKTLRDEFAAAYTTCMTGPIKNVVDALSKAAQGTSVKVVLPPPPVVAEETLDPDLAALI